MDEHGGGSREQSPAPPEFGRADGSIHMGEGLNESLFCERALADWNRAEEDAAWAHLQDANPSTPTSLLEQAIRAAKALPQTEQDAIAAAMLAWIEDERRWAESFARTQDALVELAREALAEHHAGQTLECAYAEKAADEAREAEAAARAAEAADTAGHSDRPAVRGTRKFGSARGLIHMADDFDAPLDEFREYT